MHLTSLVTWSETMSEYAAIKYRAADRKSTLAPWLSLGAGAGPILFTIAWLVLGFLSPGYSLWGTRIAPYSPISQPLSGLGLGPTGPYMNAAFVLHGLLILAGS